MRLDEGADPHTLGPHVLHRTSRVAVGCGSAQVPAFTSREESECSTATCCSAAIDGIVATVFSYIDRMNDYCEQDPAEKILDEFTKEIDPILMKYIEENCR